MIRFIGKTNILLLVLFIFSTSCANAGIKSISEDVYNSTKDFSIRTGNATWNFTKKSTSVLGGVLVGPVISLPRGIATGAVIGTNEIAEVLGDVNGRPHKTFGAISGGVAGSLSGGIASLFKGIANGIVYGSRDPFSKESISLTGEDFLDYEPFSWNFD